MLKKRNWSRASILFISGIVLGSVTNCLAQESEKVEYSIYLQPGKIQEFEKEDIITLCVHTRKEGAGTRGIGLAIGMEIIGVEKHANYFKYDLRLTMKQKEAIEKASRISRLWFHAGKYRDSHDATFEKDNDFEEFIKDNRGYRCSDERDWGYYKNGQRLAPPAFLLKPLDESKD